ncbi:MAG TPA: hypothetical protein VNB06_06835 [Thermoanaerobaculia bacterium]|nr:hypothetical protein [Thermoanaerobaculia bacterium]
MKMRLRDLLAMGVVGAVLLLPLAGCQEKSTGEEVREAAEAVGDEIGDAAESAVDAVGEVVDDTAEAVEDVVEGDDGQ